MDKSLNILVNAYACGPEQGSEPGVGWGFVNALGKRHKVYLITEKWEFEESLDYALDKDPVLKKNVQVHYIRRKQFGWLERVFPPVYYWSYKLWQKKALKVARSITRRVEVDVVHQLNMVGYREPGYLYELNLPLVWGPVGGYGYLHPKFLYKLRFSGRIRYLTYNIMNFIQARSHRRVSKMMKTASVIAMNKENCDYIKKLYKFEPLILIPVGAPPSLPKNGIPARAFSEKEVLRLVWVGGVIHRKFLNLALEIVASLPRSINYSLDVYGDGSEVPHSRSQCVELGIELHVQFHGSRPRDVVLNAVAEADVMLFTSLREGTPTVVVEAQCAGTPVVCFDWSGMTDMCSSSDLLVAPDPSTYIESFVAKLVKLHCDERYYAKCVSDGYEAAQSLGWDNKVKKLEKIYESVIENPSDT